MYYYNEKTGVLHIKDHCTHSKKLPSNTQIYATEMEARDSVGHEVQLCENCRKIRNRRNDEEKCEREVPTTIETQTAVDACTQEETKPTKRKVDFFVIGTFLLGSIFFAISSGEILMSLLVGLLLAILVFSVRSYFRSIEEKNARERKEKLERALREKAERELREKETKKRKRNGVRTNPNPTIHTYHSGMTAYDKAIYDKCMETISSSTTASKPKKPASVVGRAAAGAVIAGPAGAVVGALSAVDKNNRSKK